MRELTLEITSKCFQHCSWCSSSSSELGEHMPLDIVLGYLNHYSYRKAHETKNTEWCTTLRLSGGEPTLHPDIVEIAKASKDLGYYLILMTCGYDNTDRLLPYVDEYILHTIYTPEYWIRFYLEKSKKLSLQSVLAKGNEDSVLESIRLSFKHKIPLRLLALQKQGRGVDCEPLGLVSWTGDKGCHKEDKITVTHGGKVVTCSALKYKDECDLECGR